MRSLLILGLCLFTLLASAQTEPIATSNSPEKINTNNLQVQVNTKSGEIKLINTSSKATHSSAHFNVEQLELTIFTNKGEYTGTLKLNELKFPVDELEKNELVKVSKIKLTHIPSGIAYQPTNIRIIPK